MKDLIKKYGGVTPPTLEQRIARLIDDCIRILIEDKKEIAIEKLFDFSILEELEIENKNKYQDYILNWRCEEFERKEMLRNGNNIK